MSDYIIGGWAQSVSHQPPTSFSYTMYGMVTNLEFLTTGTPSNPGWSPASTLAPRTEGKALWTYGGGGCLPRDMPANSLDIDKIVQATELQQWAGVDFDDECNMNTERIITTMRTLKPKQSSYTFLAGWAYNNPEASPSGQAINEAVAQISMANVADRYIMMCYGSQMWTMKEIKANVGAAIKRTIEHDVPEKKIILALTPRGLTSEALDYFLHQVISNRIGGLFVWNFPALKPDHLETIEMTLGINSYA